jgi:aminoglycoside phosphotransferase (APT) family kinase protein
MQEVADWLLANLPVSEHTAFIHNDFKYDNLVLDPENPGKVIAVLDWEMATVGDPFMDLGTSLAYWCEANDPDTLKPFNLTWLPGNLTRKQVIECYEEKSGKSVPNMLFYYVFGAFKIGVIVQQIFARYKKGHTHDPRFAGLIHVVNACGNNAMKALNAGKI